MEITIDLNRTIKENANKYFAEAKKFKLKLQGVQKAIPDTEKKLEELKQKGLQKKAAKPAVKRKKEWYEKFHWFFSSDGLLVLAGRDAKSNESLVKKYMSDNDLYFHSDIHGAAHVFVQCKEPNKATEATQNEAAQFAAIFSSAWREGFNSLDVYSVLPSQVSKKAPTGEFLTVGAFIIEGERKWFRKTQLDFSIGYLLENGSIRIISGPTSAIKKNAAFSVKLIQGNLGKNEAAKKLKQLFDGQLKAAMAELDEIMQMLPNGNFKILK